jgi:CTD small phosphatase-like protein 2
MVAPIMALTPMHPARPVTEADRAPSESFKGHISNSNNDNSNSNMMLVTTGAGGGHEHEHEQAVVGLESVAEEHADAHHRSSSSSSIMANMCAPNGSGSSWVGSVSKSLFSPVLSLFQNSGSSSPSSSPSSPHSGTTALPTSEEASASASASAETKPQEYKETPAVTADTMDTMTIADTRNTGTGRSDPDGDVAMANACHANGDYSATTTVVYEAHKESHMTSSSSTMTSTNKDVNNMNASHAHANHGDVSQESSGTYIHGHGHGHGHDHGMHTIQKQGGESIDDDTTDEEEIQAPHAQQQIQIRQEQEHDSHEHSQDYEDDDNDNDEEEEFNPYLFIKCLPYYSSVVPHPQSKICLPPKSRDSPPICLVLDLDETLVHCTVEPTPNADMIFPVNFNGIEYQVHVRTRPFLFEFLERVSQKFEVICFTASQQVYADELLDRIDPGTYCVFYCVVMYLCLFIFMFIFLFYQTIDSPNIQYSISSCILLLLFFVCLCLIAGRKHIRHRMFRESCLSVEGNYLKDLNVLGRDLRKAVLVDNSPHAFGYQVDNGIPIESWFDDPHDTELLKLERFLRTLHDYPDVRQAVRAKFQTHKLIDRA